MTTFSHQTLEITHYTTYDDDIFSFVTFDIHAQTRAVLLGLTAMQNDTVALFGQLRNRGILDLETTAFQDASRFVNAGTVNQNGNVSLIGDGGVDDDVVVVRNLGPWTLEANTEITTQTTGPVVSRFVNLGTLADTAGGINLMQAPLISRGTVDVEGAFTFDGAVRLLAGDLTGGGAATFNSSVLFDRDNVAVASVSANAVRMLGDVTTTSTNLAFTTLTLAGGATFEVKGFNTTLTLNAISGKGTVNIEGVATIGGSAIAGSVNFVNSDTVYSGAAVITAAPNALGAIEIHNMAGASWTANGATSFVAVNGAANASFLNDGAYENASAAATTFSMAVVNNGSISGNPFATKAPYGGFVFNGALSGHGDIQLGNDNVTINNAVAAGQTFNFVSANADAAPVTLTLNDVQDFDGAITGFSGSTRWLSVNTSQFALETFQAGTDGGSLIFSNGSASASVQLVGSFDASRFYVAKSADGDTTVIEYLPNVKV